MFNDVKIDENWEEPNVANVANVAKVILGPLAVVVHSHFPGDILPRLKARNTHTV